MEAQMARIINSNLGAYTPTDPIDPVDPPPDPNVDAVCTIDFACGGNDSPCGIDFVCS
jgi:hypothetical protein